MTRANPFKIEIPDAALADLRERLSRTRWAHEFANEDWAYGTQGAALRELCAYWRDEFDWRSQERAMNAFSHFRAEVAGVPIHFIHERGVGPRPLPIILSHGWPWTFWDWHKVLPRLADPARFGGDPADAFDVVVPSLPGYGFSSPLTKTGINFWRTADLWVELMRDVLGYERFAAHGGDWGALVTEQLGHKYAEHLYGIHLHLMAPLDIFHGQLAPDEDYAADEAEWKERNERFFALESGYSAIQLTKPQTLAFALEDSPAGLCSWILEKRRTWSDCGGDVERRFTKDDLCTTMTIYWATQTYGSSARYYYECRAHPWRPAHNRTPVVEAPTGVAAFPGEVVLMPRRWAERYYNLQRFTVMKSGGHFAPMEEPDALVDEVRAFFRPLRT